MGKYRVVRPFRVPVDPIPEGTVIDLDDAVAQQFVRDGSLNPVADDAVDAPAPEAAPEAAPAPEPEAAPEPTPEPTPEAVAPEAAPEAGASAGE